MAETASAALRRLHEEATLPKLTPEDIPTAQQLHDYFAARGVIDNALHEIAALVEACEERHAGECGNRLADALSALRAKLGVGQ